MQRILGARTSRHLVWLAAWATATACASDPATSGAAKDATNGMDTATADTATLPGITYWEHIAPIYEGSCTGCHSEAGVGPFPLQTYAQAKATAAMALSAVQQGRMPPWGAETTAACQPRFGFAHDLRLTESQKQELASWVVTGMAEGDPKKKPVSTVDSDILVLKNVDQVAAPKAGFVASGTKDQFRCFVLDADFAEDKYLNAVQFLPGNPQVVHHVLMFLDTKAESLKLANADGQYACFGDAGVQAGLVAAWAPGSVPTAYPPNAGSLIPKGSKLVMQVHYHPIGEAAAPDVTKVQLRFTAGKPELMGLTALVGNDSTGSDGEGLLPGPNDPPGGVDFVIPAGKAEHTEEMVFTIPSSFGEGKTPDLHVYAVGTHMHYVGTDMQIELERASSIVQCHTKEIGPLSTCLASNCPTQTGTDLYACAEKACGSAVGNLGSSCTECLQTELFTGKDAANIVQACQQPLQRELAGPAQECLLHTPKWDFNWQRVYQYNAPFDQLPLVRGGDKLRLRCKYNNSSSNPFVMEALESQGLQAPIDVRLGEQTLDEMCLAVVQILYKP